MKYLLVIVLLLVPITASARNYRTLFNTAENPISEGEQWVNGDTDGVSWRDVKVVGGVAKGTQVADRPEGERYDDSTALITGTWGNDQSAYGVVYKNGAISKIAEVEIRLRSTVSSGVNSGYEVLFSAMDANPYVQIVEWNGGLGSYTVLNSTSGVSVVGNGDIVKATMIGTTIRAYINNVEVLSTTDATFTSGDIGLGFYITIDTPDPQDNFGFTEFYATDGTMYRASSCSKANVETALASASNGDTVIIPSGSCTWTTGITTSKQVNFAGEVNGATILTLNGDAAIFNVTTGSSYSTEISNMKFLTITSGTNTSASYVYIAGVASDKPFLIHDCEFEVGYGPEMSFVIDIHRMGGGIIYDNYFWGNDNANCSTGCGTPGGGFRCGGQLGIRQKAEESQSVTSWSTDPTMGDADTTGINNIYVEDNTFTNIEDSCDWDDGARAVIRNNVFNDSPVATHGADTSYYGIRHIEIYDNTFVHNLTGTWTIGGVTGYYPRNMAGGWVGQRGGTSVITGNTIPEMYEGCWAKTTEVLYQIQQIDRDQGPDDCCDLSSYVHPCFHQVGRGKDNGSEPAYVWSNTYTGGGSFTIGITNSGNNDANCITENPTNYNNPGYYIQANRDYYASAKPGWTRYTYPHPLRTGSMEGGVTTSTTTTTATMQGASVQGVRIQ